MIKSIKGEDKYPTPPIDKFGLCAFHFIKKIK